MRRILLFFILGVLIFTISCNNILGTQSSETYKIHYYDNGADQGTLPNDSNEYEEGESVVIAEADTLKKDGYNFDGWNTNILGEGTSYEPGSAINIGNTNLYLYAQWKKIPVLKIDYDGNGHTDGDLPFDLNKYNPGDNATVQGNPHNIAKINVEGTSYKFAGWNTKVDGSGESYYEGDSIEMGNENIVLYAQWEPYELRDIGPAGGYIFYIKEEYSDGWRYLEAAPYDQSAGTQWFLDGFITTGATGELKGTGDANTTKIVDTIGPGNYAAYLCSELEIGGYDDWYLPSVDEMTAMSYGLKKSDYGGVYYDVADIPDGGRYWSSSETNSFIAFAFLFADEENNGNAAKYLDGKDSVYRVRAARKF